MSIPQKRKIYIVMFDHDNGWSVVDARTGRDLVVDGVPMTLLTREQATALVEAANQSASVLTLH